MPLPDYSMVISTYERPGPLREALESLTIQSHHPARVIVVDASAGHDSEHVCQEFASRLSITYQKSSLRSAAMQRNAGSVDVNTVLIGFMDDDVVLYQNTMARMSAPFADDPQSAVGGVGGRIVDMQHPKPSGLLWLYYRLQAGYSHPHYGGRVFGPALNCLPCYDEESALIESDWLNAGCVLYRTEVFSAEKFPEFEGYSFMEDVHLSARIARSRKLYFDPAAAYEHRTQPSIFKRDYHALAKSQILHRRRVATEVLGRKGVVFEVKFFLHKLFSTFNLVRHRQPGWREELTGTWSA